MGETILSIKDLKVYYYLPQGTVRAVDGVSLDIYKGEVLGIAGESGSGKSTLITTIMGLIREPGRIVEGEIWFENKNLLSLTSEEYREIRGKDIAMVFQDPISYLDPLFTTGFQVGEVYEAHEGVKPMKALDKVIQVFRQVRISDPENRVKSYPHQMSGGMNQRVLISMGIAARPKLLIADEPTSALDVTIQAEIMELLAELKKELKMTMIFVSHDLNLLGEISDRIAVMYAGKIVEVGPTKDIMEDPLHPYTKALLSSISFQRKSKIRTVKGSPPSLIKPPSGCRFHPRCPMVKKECRSVQPSLRKLNENRYVACHLYM